MLSDSLLTYSCSLCILDVNNDMLLAVSAPMHRHSALSLRLSGQVSVFDAATLHGTVSNCEEHALVSQSNVSAGHV